MNNARRPHEIESPWEREKRIEQVMRGMNQAAYDRRQWDLDAPKRAREAAWRAKIALEREQQPTAYPQSRANEGLRAVALISRCSAYNG